MATVIERRGSRPGGPAAQTHRTADLGARLGNGDAANDAALGQRVDVEQDDLRAARGFAAAVAGGAMLWAAVGALVWLGLR
jgi:hypothetical protein